MANADLSDINPNVCSHCKPLGHFQDAERDEIQGDLFVCDAFGFGSLGPSYQLVLGDEPGNYLCLHDLDDSQPGITYIPAKPAWLIEAARRAKEGEPSAANE